MPATRLTPIVSLGHGSEAPTEVSQLPPSLQVEASPPLGLRGPDSSATAQLKRGGCRPGAAPPESAVLPSLLSREGSSKYTQAAHTPHRELQFGRWQSQLG